MILISGLSDALFSSADSGRVA